MNYKKLLTIILPILLASAISSCDRKNDDLELVVSVHELSTEKNSFIDDLYTNHNDNLTFEKGLDFFTSNEIYVLSIMCVDNYQRFSNDIFNYYVTDEVLKSNQINDTGYNYYPFGQFIYDKDLNYYCAVGCTGFFSFSTQNSIIIDFENAKDSYENISMYNLDITTKKIVDNAHIYVSDFSYRFDKGSSYYPTDILSFRVNHDIFYRVYHELILHDLPVFDVLSKNHETSFDIAPFMGFETISDSKGNVVFIMRDGAFQETLSKQRLDYVIPPNYAAKLLSKKLASNVNYIVKELRLAYIPIFEKNIENEYTNNPIHRINAPWATNVSYDLYELNPYWIFIFDGTVGKEIIGMVNCIDGSVEFYNNK